MNPAPAAGSRRVALNSLLQAGADAVGKVGLLFLYAVMAREAGAAAFGNFLSAAALASLILVAGFGMDFRVTRLVAKHEQGAPEAFWSAMLLKSILGLIALCVVTGVAVVGPYPADVVYTTALIGLAVVFELIMLTPQAVFRGLERLQPVATALILYRTSLAAAGIALLLAGASIVAVAVAWLAASLIGLAYTVYRARAERLELPWGISRESIRLISIDSVGLGMAGVFGVALSRVDIVILGFLKDSDAVAFYGGAFRLVESTQFLVTAFGLSSFPALARLTQTSTPSIGEATALASKIALMVTVPLGILFALYPQLLIGAIYGPNLEGAVIPLQLLSPAVVLGGLFSVLAFALTAQERQWAIVVVLGLAAVANVVLNFTLIPTYSEAGAAVAMDLTMLVMGALLLPAIIRTAGRLPFLRSVAGPAVAGAAMAGTGLLLGVSIPSALASVAVFAILLGLIEHFAFPEDAKRLRSVFRPGSGA